MLKRSMTIHGHRTSIALEPLFWRYLEQLALERNLAISALIAEIDNTRTKALMRGEETGGLSSMIRVYLLQTALENR